MSAQYSNNNRGATKKRIAYSLAASATMSSFVDSSANADVVYSGLQSLPVQQGLEPLALQMNDGDTFADITLSNYIFLNGYYQGAFVPFFGGFVVGRAPANGLNYAAALTEGTLIDGSAPFKVTSGASMAYGATNPNAQFNDVEGAFLGFAFPIGEDIHYGWLRVDVDNAAGTFVVQDWAWEGSAGVGIAAGDIGTQTPAPGDFNEDGLVDGRDFLAWQSGDSPTPFSASDLDAWQTAYNGGSLTASVNVVPEAVTLGMLAAGAAGLLFMRQLRPR